MDTTTAKILAASCADPTADALGIMRLSLVDWMACGIAGVDEPVARLTRDLALSEGGSGQATLFGGAAGPARAAAQVNGATSHALDYDDTHFGHIGHPSVAVNPAVLAAAELCGATMHDVVRAALAGCEASVRFGLWFGRAHYQHGFHQTATAGAFGATVGAGQVLGLDAAQMGCALGLVSTRAAGLKSQFGTMGKPYNAGIAAMAGLEAAQLAAAGFISNPAAIAGQNGFLATHHCDGSAAHPDGFVMQDVSHKFHACCHGLHATLEALRAFNGAPSDITAITVTTHPRWMTVCNQPTPDTGLEAKFSYRAVVALALTGHDTGALNTFDDTCCHKPEVTALRDKVSVVTDDRLTEMQARVAIKTHDDTIVLRHDLAAPMSLDVKTARIRAKAAALIGETRATHIWQAVQGDTLSDLTAQM